MKKGFLALCFAMLSLAVITTSCSSDDGKENIYNQQSTVKISFTGVDIATVKQLTIEILETNSGKQVEKTITEKNTELLLDKGSYKITVNGQVLLTNSEEAEVGGSTSLNIIENEKNIVIDLVIKTFSEDFIIEEIFFTGVRTIEGKQYTGGRFFKLTNNTNKVLSTGGLLICQSEFNTTINHNVTPDIKAEAFAVQAVLMIPTEQSKDVQPGDFVIIADMAQNHKTPNIPAYDLSLADYEFPNLDNPKLGQVDNPAVPNAVVIFSKLNFNMFFLHDRGFESYAIARFPEGVTVASWIRDYIYNYEYVNSAGRITQKTTSKIMNDWIIDGVNSAATEKWVHNALANSIDSGWTGCGTIDSDPSRYGNSIRRKVIGQMENGKNLYKDTNNSTADFIRDSQVSIKNGIVH